MKRIALVVVVVAGLALLSAPAQAKGKPGVSALPPTNMVVDCGNQARVIGNVPARTGIVYYHFYKLDPYYSWTEGIYTAQIPSESGPGRGAPYFLYEVNVDYANVYVWAEAYTKSGRTPLAWGFAPCRGNPSIAVWASLGETLYWHLDGQPLGTP